MRLRAICFDVDGVLLDSLDAHLKVCADKSREFGLKLEIPSPREFREMVRRGVTISPMEKMFEAVGFPKQYAERANDEYKATFATDYPIMPFPKVEEMLSNLGKTNVRLGLITANVKANVERGLGRTMRFFDSDCIFTKDGQGGSSKAEAIRAAAETLSVSLDEFLYVGDQPADWWAARDAGVPFLGVTYGWGISKDDHEFSTMDTVVGIADFVVQNNTAITGETGAAQATA